MKKIVFDYIRAKNIKPLRPSRDLGKFFDNAERGAWEVLKAYGIKQKRGQVLPDQTITDKYSEADVRVACRVLENIERGRIYWRALQGERNRAEALVFNVATIIEQLNAAATKSTSANRKKARIDRAELEAHERVQRDDNIRKKARKLMSDGTAKHNLIGKLIDYAKRYEPTWPRTRNPYTAILK